MQTLLFNTTTKIVKVTDGPLDNSSILFHFENVPTVKVNSTYYEVMRREDDGTTVPVLRVPISNTNMVIEK